MEKKKISEQEYADLIVVAYQECLNDPAIKSRLEKLIGNLSSDKYRLDNEVSVIDLIKLALQELGYNEKDSNDNVYETKFSVRGSKNRTKYANDLDKLSSFYNMKYKDSDNAFWCDIFFDWLFVKTFGESTARELTCQYEGRVRGANTNMSNLYYLNADNLTEEEKAYIQLVDDTHKIYPRLGDQIFFGKNGKAIHTGVVCAVDYNNEFVYVIEGNSLPYAGRVTEEGRGVYMKKYKFDDPKIVACRTPRFTDKQKGNNERILYLCEEIIGIFDMIEAKMNEKIKDFPEIENVPPSRKKLLNSVKGLKRKVLNSKVAYKCRLIGEDLTRKKSK